MKKLVLDDGDRAKKQPRRLSFSLAEDTLDPPRINSRDFAHDQAITIQEHQDQGTQSVVMLESQSTGAKTIAWLLLTIGLAIAAISLTVFLTVTGIEPILVLGLMIHSHHLSTALVLGVVIPCMVASTLLVAACIKSLVDSRNIKLQLASRNEDPLYTPAK